MKKKLTEFFSVKRLVLFLMTAGLFLVFYTPHLAFRMDIANTGEGTLMLANYNTDNGEEIFESYNYNGHKTWRDVAPYYKEVNISTIPLVTNLLQLQVNGISDMDIKKIDISFGPIVLHEFTANDFTQQIAGSQGLDITFENDQIHLHLQNVEGWIIFANEEYMPKQYILLVYAAVFLLAWIIAVIIDKHLDLIDRIPLNELMLIAAPLWIFFLSESILGNIFYIDLGHRLLNVGIMIIVYKLFHIIFRRLPISILISNLLFVIYAIVSTFVVRFRNRPIAPWDFSAWGTALDVASNYEISINYVMAVSLIAAVLIYLLMRAVPRDKSKINKWYAAYPAIIIACALFFNSIGSYYIWDVRLLSTFQNDGTALTFTGLVKQYFEDRPTKPTDYSRDDLVKLGEEYAAHAEEAYDAEAEKPVAIIQVMNESFADLSVGGTDYADNMTPFYNTLDNTIRGNLYVSVRGGGTCNSEYETLTGNSTAFFAPGVYPYNMYMNRDVPSTVSYMNQNGYETTGIHLGKETNWNRRAAYQKLKFQNTVFAETFDGLDTLHGYPSDRQDFETVIETWEKNRNKNQFIFNITYQNHGGYRNSDDLEQTVDLSEYGTANYDSAENYLSLIKVTDEAFEELINYYKNVDEKVMIVMYGDHQPSLGAASDRLFFPTSGTAEEDMKKFVTPFLIWANYDIEDQTIDKMSSNYMSSMILHAANMKLTPYQQFLYELMDKYPVISLYGCYDAEGNFYESVDHIDDELINQYRNLQYNNVFDSDRIESLFWPSGNDE